MMNSSPVRIGDFHFALTYAKNFDPGIPPSRANAYIIRELEVIEKVLLFENLEALIFSEKLDSSPAEEHRSNSNSLGYKMDYNVHNDG
jgi:hypothetical protein